MTPSPSAVTTLVRDFLERGDKNRDYDSLTPRELEVLKLIAEGKTSKEIAELLVLSIKTVERHRADILHRLSLEWSRRHACLLGAGRHLGLHRSGGGPPEGSTSTGIRVVAAVVVVLLVAAVLVVLARVGLWQQAFVSDRMIRFFAWALAAVFLVETVAAFT